jgi:hypothetical protein
MFANKAGDFLSEAPFRCLALPKNIQLGWKGLSGKNTHFITNTPKLRS